VSAFSTAVIDLNFPTSNASDYPENFEHSSRCLTITRKALEAITQEQIPFLIFSDSSKVSMRIRRPETPKSTKI
jgi:hypothetical protein